MTFLEKIDMLMESKGLNKRKLSQIADVPYTTIDGLYKKGYENVRIPTIRKIAKALGVTADFLIDEEPAENLYGYDIFSAAHKAAKRYTALDPHGQHMVEVVLAGEEERMATEREAKQQAEERAKPKTKVIPLMRDFAAGTSVPADAPVEDYEVSVDSPADFAVKVSGDSMDPYFADGEIALGIRRLPNPGEIVAIMIDGENFIKQIAIDSYSNIYLFSLNRKRKDKEIMHDSGQFYRIWGTILTDQRIPPLPTDLNE